MKDNFSAYADKYAKFRPTYPRQLYDFLLGIVPSKQTAWDCGTGNGQVAHELSNYFEKVYATDISEKQLQNAVKKENIIYKVERAEATSFNEKSFDLVTVGQAIHWFKFTEFYDEVRRTIKPRGVLAVFGYGLIRIDETIDKIIDKLYYDIVGPYWDKERKYVDENYKTIPFPFNEIDSPQLKNQFEWTFDEMIGYLETWSAVQHYIKANQQNPVDLVHAELKKKWGNNTKTVHFPILLRVARI